MSIWVSWGDEDEVRAVQYREGWSNHYPSEREDERVTLDFAHIAGHLVKHYRRQRWLRVSVFKGEPWKDADTLAEFCINVRQAKKLIAALTYFVENASD